MKSMSKDAKNFYKNLWTLVLPIAIQNFISNAVNSMDVFMLGLVGQSELSAVSLANQFQFILFGFFFGINSGITIMAAQYWGKKDTKAIQKIMGIAIKISMAITGMMALGGILFPTQLMGIYTNNTELVNIGAKYLQIIAVSYFLMSFSQSFQATLRSVERAGLSTIISTVALFLNVSLNAVFIFGLLGAPKLGVIGVAYATLISRIVEFVLCLYFYLKGTVCTPDMKDLFGHSAVLMGDFLKYSMPALINDLSWTLAFSLYSVIMGHLNADIVAANSVVTTVRDLCAIMGYAISGGASVLLGIEIGKGEMELVKKDASRACLATFACAVVTALIIILIRPLVYILFTLTPVAKGYLEIMMWISSYYVIGQLMNTLLIAGVFRSGGETKFGMVVDIVTMWVISVPLGFLTAFVFKWPPMVVYFVLCLDEFWKIPVVYKYYKSYKWVRNITRDNI